MANSAFATLRAAEPRVAFPKDALRVGHDLVFRSWRDVPPEVWRIVSVHRTSPGGYLAAVRTEGAPVVWGDKLVLSRHDGMSKIIGAWYARASSQWWALTLPGGE